MRAAAALPRPALAHPGGLMTLHRAAARSLSGAGTLFDPLSHTHTPRSYRGAMRISLLISPADIQEGILLFADREGSPMPWLKRYFSVARDDERDGQGGLGGGAAGASGSGAGAAAAGAAQ